MRIEQACLSIMVISMLFVATTRLTFAQESSSVPVKTGAAVESNAASLDREPADTSNAGTIPHFELGAVQNEIWSPVKPNSILQGIVDKKSSEQPIRLIGGVSDDRSPLNTIQRLLNRKLLTGLSMLQPRFDLSGELDSQLARSKRQLAGQIEQAKKLMNLELSHQLSPHYDIPDRNRQPLRNLQAEIEKPLPFLSAEVEKSRRLMELQLAQARKDNLCLPSDFCVPRPKYQIPADRAKPDAGLELARKQMEMELSRVKGKLVMPDFSTNLDWQITSARKNTDAQIASARPALEAVYMRMRQPQANLDVSGKMLESKSAYDKIISWDAWYARVAQAYEPILLKAIARRGNPAGSNTVSITVWPNHRLQAVIVEKSNRNFDSATIEAYQSLNGNKILEFPPGSKREKITFLVDNQHQTPHAVSDVNSQTYKGDNEVLRGSKE